MGAKFREKRKLPSEINFVVLNFVPKAFATKAFATKAFATKAFATKVFATKAFTTKVFATKVFATKVFAKFRDSGNSHESHEIWHPPKLTCYTVAFINLPPINGVIPFNNNKNTSLP